MAIIRRNPVPLPKKGIERNPVLKSGIVRNPVPISTGIKRTLVLKSNTPVYKDENVTVMPMRKPDSERTWITPYDLMAKYGQVFWCPILQIQTVPYVCKKFHQRKHPKSKLLEGIEFTNEHASTCKKCGYWKKRYPLYDEEADKHPEYQTLPVGLKKKRKRGRPELDSRTKRERLKIAKKGK